MRFRKVHIYYEIDCFETLLNVPLFIEKGLFIVIDCLRQNESVKSATVHRIFKENVAIVYCLIIGSRGSVQSVVRKIT